MSLLRCNVKRVEPISGGGGSAFNVGVPQYLGHRLHPVALRRQVQRRLPLRVPTQQQFLLRLAAATIADLLQDLPDLAHVPFPGSRVELIALLLSLHGDDDQSEFALELESPEEEDPQLSRFIHKKKKKNLAES